MRLMRARFVLALFAFMAAARASDEVSAMQMAVKRSSKSVDSPDERYTQEMDNFKDLSYTSNLTIGGQTMRLILDTGSFELLVFSKNCTSFSCKKTDTFFDEKKSDTFESLKWSRMHSFGSGDCSSVLATDQIEFGPNKKKQSFWEVVDANMPIIQDGSFDGILGLAHPDGPIDEISRYLKQDKLQKAECKNTEAGCPEWLINQTKSDMKFKKVVKEHSPPLKNLQVTEFSVCFLKEKGAPGYFTWHDIDPAGHPEIFTKLDVTGNFMWTSPLHKVALHNFVSHGKNKQIHLACGEQKPCHAVLDTGTSLIAAPSDVIQKFYTKLGKVDTNCDRIEEMPDLVFNFGGQEITMPPETYIGKVSGEMPPELRQFFPHVKMLKGANGLVESQCTILMMQMDMQDKDGSPLWIIGMPFFREFYTTFNMGSDKTYETKAPRHIYIAKNQHDCRHPTEYAQLPPREVAARKPVIRELDLSSIRVPPWLSRSVRAGIAEL